MTHDQNNSLTKSMFIKMFILLTFLTILTLLQPYIISTTLAGVVGIQMFISILKTFIIGAYFMHLKYEVALFKYIVTTALITLAIFFIITAFDAIYRNQTYDFFY